MALWEKVALFAVSIIGRTEDISFWCRKLANPSRSFMSRTKLYCGHIIQTEGNVNTHKREEAVGKAGHMQKSDKNIFESRIE